MLDILKDYVSENTTPEHYDIISRAYSVIDLIEFPEFDTGVEEIIMTDRIGDVDTGGTMSLIDRFFHDILDEILRQFTVKLDVDTDMLFKTVIIEGLIAIESYENVEDIFAVIEQDTDKEEKFADLMALVTEYDASRILIQLEEVEPSLLLTLAQEISARVNARSIQEANPYLLDCVEATKLYNEFIGPSGLITQELIKNEIPIALPFKVYIDIVGRNFEQLDPEVIAKELLGMAYLSSDGFSNPKSIIRDNIDNLISDMRLITLVDVQVTKLIMQVENFKINNPKVNHEQV